MTRTLLTVCAGLSLVTGAAHAVSTSRWTHTSEADFADGEKKSVVATNLGDLKLSRSVRSVMRPDARVSAIHALAEAPDGTMYAATGPQGLLLSIRGDTVADAASFGDNVSLFSLLADEEGGLLVGTGGERGEVYRIDRPGAAPERVFSLDGVQYVWAMLRANDGTVYAATGPAGQLFALRPADGTFELIYDSEENNLLSLAGGAGDLLHIGTDPNGLVLRLNRRTREAFVVYDAAESEISALAFTANGDLLAATAQATPDTPTEPEAAAGQQGRPEGGAGGMPIEAVPPEDPSPPDLPEPLPGEPRPIPKFLTVLDDPSPTQPEAAEATPLPARGAAAVAPAESGNAVYRIDRDGFVTELFRGDVAVFALLPQPAADSADGPATAPNGAESILVATGSEGMLYQISPEAGETAVLAKVDSRQILCALPARDGRVLLGCANRGDISIMASGFAETGTYTSAVLDAGQISRFGTLRLRGVLPEGSSLQLATRSGNVADPAGSGWSPWSDPVSAAEFMTVKSPPARFLQYRLAFGSKSGLRTPVVDEVEVAYQLPNLRPLVSAVRVTPGDASDPDLRPKFNIAWDSADANDDALKYSLELRPATATGAAAWMLIKDDLADSTFEWDTRTVADGRYVVRVTASDAAANDRGSGRTGSRISDPLLVDNTPPAIGDLAVQTPAGGPATIKFTCVDRTGTVARAEYALNGRADWQTVLPTDMMADSPKEAYALVLPGLKPGPHQLAIRATDGSGNTAIATVSLTIAPDAAGPAQNSP